MTFSTPRPAAARRTGRSIPAAPATLAPPAMPRNSSIQTTAAAARWPAGSVACGGGNACRYSTRTPHLAASLVGSAGRIAVFWRQNHRTWRAWNRNGRGIAYSTEYPVLLPPFHESTVTLPSSRGPPCSSALSVQFCPIFRWRK